MKIFHLTLQFDDFEAKLALGGDWSLYDLAAFLLETLEFDMDHPFQFCDNLENPYQSDEQYSLFADMGEGEGEAGVSETFLSEVFRPGKIMAFHFDYGDDWVFAVTCTAVEESTAKREFIRVLSIEGTPPRQYPEFEE